ncbi:MAG TPA: crotonase/enoyl-CoA hydratase family protein [Acidimicrobiales bacterium]|nr:crotonase/enoyl-CoA hydratase family protein [Acidimicrobiales bacterium]
MADLVTYDSDDKVAVLTLDDGKVNVLSPAMLAAIHGALDRAEAEGKVVVLTGRPGILSAGFDLATLRGGGADAVEMVSEGFRLAVRLLEFPLPVVAACSGHVIAMAVFLVLSTDYRIGAAGDFRLTANETAIGMTMPRAAIEISRSRMTPAAFHRSMVLAEVFGPAEAVDAGILDLVVAPDEVLATAKAKAAQFAELHLGAHRHTKERVRAATLTAIRAGMAEDGADFGIV